MVVSERPIERHKFPTIARIWRVSFCVCPRLVAAMTTESPTFQPTGTVLSVKCLSAGQRGSRERRIGIDFRAIDRDAA